MIDRRILIEAETLIDDGYEVYLLAGWDGKSEELFEIEGRVKVERIKYEGIDQRLTSVYKVQNYLIGLLNLISIKTDITANKICLKLNNIYALVSQLISKLIYIIFFKPLLLFVTLVLKIKSLLITSIAKTINLFVKIIVKVASFLTELNGYEHLFLKRGLFYRPDIIHIHDLPMLKAGVKLKKVLNIPLVYDMHEFYSEQDCLTLLQQKKLRKTEIEKAKMMQETKQKEIGVEEKKIESGKEIKMGKIETERELRLPQEERKQEKDKRSERQWNRWQQAMRHLARLLLGLALVPR
jgi:hypothetical protein